MSEILEYWIDGKNRTDKVAGCVKQGNFYIVSFKGSSKPYRYGKDRVVIKTREEGSDNQLLWQTLKTYFAAFCEATEAAPSTDKEDEQQPMTIVKSAIEHISENRIRGTVLDQYLTGRIHKLEDDDRHPLIYPFGCNKSQKKAVEAAFSESVSIIQGPPGTGKTQTILNIVANLLIRGKTVAVVSNNNAATQNVCDKLNSKAWELGWLVATLGSRANKTAFFENVPQVKLKDEWRQTQAATKVQLDLLNKGLDNYYEKTLELQNLKKALHETKQQYEIFLEEEKQKGFDAEGNPRFGLLQTKGAQELEVVEERIARLIETQSAWSRLWTRIMLRLQGIKGLPNEKTKLAELLTVVLASKAQSRIRELAQKIETARAWLKEHQNDEATFIDASKATFMSDIEARFRKYADGHDVKLSDKAYREATFSKRFPILTSSTYALPWSTPKGGLFDYLIIDEASQVNIPSAVICFACARNAVIVGDSRQLPTIIPDGAPKPPHSSLAAFDASRLNILESLDKRFGNGIVSTTLREHYRCHPDIIEFCNRMFYNGQLVAMTSRENRPQAFEWLVTSENRVDIDLGGQTSSRSNPRQIKETCDVFNRLTEQGIKRDSIGIVTPYKAQAGKLRSLLPDIEIDTVHKFQGREKDVVIFNSVSNKPTRFNDQPNLLNVAVSRAKDRFFLLSPAFDDYPNSNLAALVRYIRHLDPKLRKITVSPCRSVFDALYRKKPLCVVKHSGESPAEAIFRKLLEETLKEESFKTWDYSQEYPLRLIPRDFAAFTDREVQYMLNNSRLDFLIFDSIDKHPVAAIENDGRSYHQKGSRQAERDEVKNSILAKVKLPLLRLRTDSVEGQEKAQLEQFLASCLCSTMHNP